MTKTKQNTTSPVPFHGIIILYDAAFIFRLALVNKYRVAYIPSIWSLVCEPDMLGCQVISDHNV